MTGICGWYSPGLPDNSQPGQLQQMMRHLPVRHQVCEETSQQGCAALCTAQTHGNLYSDGDLVVVIEGTPRFDSSGADQNLSNAHRTATLYRKLGLNFTQDIDGSFAIALFDLKQRRSVLVVDRIGVCPLAYSATGNGLVFASTATSVYSHPDVQRGLDHQSIFNYIYFHMIPSPGTIFSGVRKLPPAHQLVHDESGLTCSRYWTPDYSYESRRNLQGKLLPVIRAAVGDAINSTDTGGFLSGGLDSSTVCGLMQQSMDHKAKVFTIGFEQEGYDELEYSRLATRHFGLDLTDYYITPSDVLSAIPEVAAAYDEPFGNSSAVPTLVCARLAKSAGINTLLAGDGGDELFAGNERYSTQKLFSYYNHVPNWLNRYLMRPFFFRKSVQQKSSGFQHKVRRYIEQASMAMPDRTQNYNLLHLLGAETLFDHGFLETVDPQEPARLLHAEYWQDGPPDQLERLLLMDYKFTLADNDLRKVNRMCDLAGVEVRYPLLDDEVIRFSNKIPANVKLKGMKLRSYYKDETSKILPPEIINKSKHGFGLPFGEWLKQDAQLSDHINNNISSMRERHVFASEFLDDLQHRHQNQHAAYYGNLVWVIAMLEEWLQQHDLTV